MNSSPHFHTEEALESMAGIEIAVGRLRQRPAALHLLHGHSSVYAGSLLIGAATNQAVAVIDGATRFNSYTLSRSAAALRRRIQKDAGEYATNNLNAMVVRELARYGINLRAGKIIEYIIVDQTGKRDPQKAKSLMTYQYWDGYDTDKYAELLLKAVETLLSPFGYTLEHLLRHFNLEKGEKRTEVRLLPEGAQFRA
jgi:hypothetical protein